MLDRRKKLVHKVGGGNAHQPSVGIGREAYKRPVQHFPVDEQFQFALHVIHQFHGAHRSGMGVQQIFQRCRVHHRKPGDVPALCQGLGIQTLFPGQQQEQGPGPVAVLEDEVLEPRYTQGFIHFFRLSGGLRLSGELHPFIGDSQPFQQFIAFPFPVTGEGGGASGLPCRYSKSFAHTDLLLAGTGKTPVPLCKQNSTAAARGQGGFRSPDIKKHPAGNPESRRVQGNIRGCEDRPGKLPGTEGPVRGSGSHSPPESCRRWLQ